MRVRVGFPCLQPVSGPASFSDNTLEAKCVSFGLTNREIEVMSRVFTGKTDKEIAQTLGTSPRTVHHQLERIYRKLKVRSRTEAIHRLILA
jgi:DNA-binding NarL/FixJ family response regulator